MGRKVAAACAAATLLLVGCGSDTGTKPAPTLSPSAANDLFLTATRTLFPGFSDTRLIDMGKQQCKALDDGLRYDRVIDANIRGGLTVDQTLALVVAAIHAYCPKQADQLPSKK